MSELLYRPGISDGAYPQRSEFSDVPIELAAEKWWRATGKARQLFFLKQRWLCKKVNRYQDSVASCSHRELQEAIAELKEHLRLRGISNQAVFRSFAIIRELSHRILGQRHYDAQLYGGWVIMNGAIAEMTTGEGKTLTTLLPACTAALAGIPVHVITANDYLASRDAKLLEPLYKQLGLTAASVVDGMSRHDRESAYRCDVVHTTSNQVAFDYLRDLVKMGTNSGPLTTQATLIASLHSGLDSSPFLLPGLCFAIVDEADAVLIDGAKTPLVLSRQLSKKGYMSTYADALWLASSLTQGKDFSVNQANFTVEITLSGLDLLEDFSLNMDKDWRNATRRETLVKMALSAVHIYKRDTHYIVENNKIIIVDEYTGRVMSDRTWQQGLHQMIEAKEGCQISDLRETLASISYQRFFQRYLNIAGTTGTAKEAQAEFKSVYGLNVVSVAPHRPSKRRLLPTQIYSNQDYALKTMIESVEAHFKLKRPVLIGTRTVQQSLHVSQLLDDAELPHKVLNAIQDKKEADIIARAGKMFSITVATNMAGRGTDIELGPEVESQGGLHVISIALNESKRIDRQLIGRCGRQGDSGSAEVIISLEDNVIRGFYPSAILKLLSVFCRGKIKKLPKFMSHRVVSLPQWHNEIKNRRARFRLLQLDRKVRNKLALFGSQE